MKTVATLRLFIIQSATQTTPNPLYSSPSLVCII